MVGGAPRSRSRGRREVQTERRSRRSPEANRPEVEPDYSYYDSYSEEERDRKERNTEEKGASAKSRARPRSTSADRRRQEKATPAVKEEVQEKQSERPRSEKRVRGVVESKVEAGTEEDKKRSKEQYLRSLEERQQAEKQPIRLEERDRSSRPPTISSGQALWRWKEKEEEEKEEWEEEKEKVKEVTTESSGRRRPRRKQQWKFIISKQFIREFGKFREREQWISAAFETEVRPTSRVGSRTPDWPSRSPTIRTSGSWDDWRIHPSRNQNGELLSPDDQVDRDPNQSRRPRIVFAGKLAGFAPTGGAEQIRRRNVCSISSAATGEPQPVFCGSSTPGDLHSRGVDSGWSSSHSSRQEARKSGRSCQGLAAEQGSRRQPQQQRLGPKWSLGSQWRRHAWRALQRKRKERKVKEQGRRRKDLLSMERHRSLGVEQAKHSEQRGEQREGGYKVEEVSQVFQKQSALPLLEGRSLRKLGIGLWNEFLRSDCPDKTSDLFCMDAADSQWLEKMCQSVRAFRERRELFPLPSIWGERLKSLGVFEMNFSEVRDFSDVDEIAVCCWSELSIVFLNYMYGRFLGVRVNKPTRAQEDLLRSLENGVVRLLRDDCDIAWTERDIEEDFKKKTLSYTGEEIAKAESLSIERVIAALPPEEHGGKIAVQTWLSGKSRWYLENPHECLMPDVGQVLPKLQAKVHIRSGDEKGLAALLVKRGICTWVHDREVLRYRGQKVLNGMFGVQKSVKVASGETALRCIMNLIPSNSVLREIEGRVCGLPSITQWINVHLDTGEELRLYQNDMVSAFYLFALPETWAPLLCFNLSFESSEIDGMATKESGRYYLACRVLPMGWTSAVGVMQQIAEEVLLRNGLPPAEQVKRDSAIPKWMIETLEEAERTNSCWWQVYLDNYAGAEKTCDGLPGLGMKRQEEVEKAWTAAGIISSEKKKVSCADGAVELGAFVGGKGQWIGASAERLLKTIKASLWLLRKKRKMSSKQWQMVLGRWVFCYQFRRPCMSLFEQAWEVSAKNSRKSSVIREARRELLMACFSAGVCHTWLGARIDDQTTCSDASMTGGAVAVGKQLTVEGSNFLKSLEPQFKAHSIPVYVVSLFNGIGGSLRCYDVAGTTVKGALLVDIHKPGNRICSRRWPFADIWEDIRTLKKSFLESIIMKCEPVEEIHVWAGFPCVDLSSAKANRANLAGRQSSLIHEAIRIIRELEELFPNVKVHYVVENVASMDCSARDEISYMLGVEPYKLDPSAQVPMNRPRFCWTSITIFETEEVHLKPCEGYTEIQVQGTWPLSSQWLAEDCWQTDPTVVYPTCMKAIKRAAPPPRPAGIDRTDAEARGRWMEDNYRYPPINTKSSI